VSALVQAALVGAGGVGAVCRYTLDGAVTARWQRPFPLATLLINVTGSLLLGVLTGLVLFHSGPSTVARIVGTGFCGGYTTFSTASVETVRLAQRRRWRLAATNALGTPLLSVAAAALGLFLSSL
jgi:fluoride exporter